MVNQAFNPISWEIEPVYCSEFQDSKDYTVTPVSKHYIPKQQNKNNKHMKKHICLWILPDIKADNAQSSASLITAIQNSNSWISALFWSSFSVKGRISKALTHVNTVSKKESNPNKQIKKYTTEKKIQADTIIWKISESYRMVYCMTPAFLLQISGNLGHHDL